MPLSLVVRITTVVAAHSAAAITPKASPSSEARSEANPSAKAIATPAKASSTPDHCSELRRSLGRNQCSPSAVRQGARYTNTTMRDAPVQASPE